MVQKSPSCTMDVVTVTLTGGTQRAQHSSALYRISPAQREGKQRWLKEECWNEGLELWDVPLEAGLFVQEGLG